MSFRFFSHASRAPGVRTRRPNKWSLAKLEPRIFLAGDAGAAVSDAATGNVSAEVGAAAVESCLESSESNEIVFVDSTVADITLVANALERGADLVALSADRDGVQQIQQHLQHRTGVEAIHIVSHGTDGQLRLGNSTLDSDSLSDHANALRDWGASLSFDADILIYGCDVAASVTGETLLNEIARLTGADIAASNDRTGNASRWRRLGPRNHDR